MKNKDSLIRLRSFSYDTLDETVSRMDTLSKEHNITLGGVIPLPTKKTRITLLRSPHVNKQSREQLETRRHSRLLKVKASDQDTIIAFLKEVEDTCPVGVTIRATLGFMKKDKGTA